MLQDDIPAEIETLFSKHYQYVKEANWLLPGSGEAFISAHEEFQELLALKDSLNQVKNLLSDKRLDEWHQHTSFTNKAGKVVSEVRRSANAELCTQAWCKFHEILGTYSLLPNEALWNRELNTIHLCEAPGAFVASLNHYLKTQALNCDWNWVANTLNPYHEANDGLVMITDDRLIANTLPWWFFGPDNTGDVMTLKHLTGLQHFISNMPTVHLITADGSFDCQGNPGEQESLVSPLHYCEVVTCLATLGKGGSFVLKMFTLFQHSSVNLMYLLNCSFDQVHIIKPGTSKAGNSEVYVVCLGYSGKEPMEDLLSKMIQNFGADIVSKALFPHRILPASFMRCHLECCTLFHKHQTETIMGNLQLFSYMGEEEKSRLNALRDYAVSYYFQKFQIKRIPRKHWLVRKVQAGCSVGTRCVSGRVRSTDTFNERKQLESLTWAAKVAAGYFSPWLKEHFQDNVGAGCFLEGGYGDPKISEWYILEGKLLTRIQSSPFCDSEELKSLNAAIEGCFKASAEDSFPSCPLCVTLATETIGTEVVTMTQAGQRVLVCGSRSLSEFLNARQVPCLFIQSPCSLKCSSVLHDGDPAYQQQLLNWVLHALNQLQDGDSLVLPVLSSFTRVTAGILYVLYHCFQVITFSCPATSLAPGADTLLLCCGFRAPCDVFTQHLELLKERTECLLSSGSSRQVLQFAPIEALLRGPFLYFLWDLNGAIVRYRLHVIGHHESERTLASIKPQSRRLSQDAEHT
ncbi:cap-specific mRNA (nucleoside-2'-O-)-methyltransferase 2 [Spea bombifrons]|uniref:cap-specific mRNA (nucleoside-2'-O-)-methyltransferase 2 n=1 Tax=Spea bombifrons TaxID=233779 RepID=UPI0023492F43|nr:cap-specific mRNA (nucleoside-2'-O-)-methyltransferase 2 [Spea bombifrons]